MKTSMKKILVIDDEADIREVLSTSLQLTTDWKVETASSGKDGVLKAIKYRPDAIVLDFMMPEMDGPTAARMLQAQPETSLTPVVLLTAKAHMSDREGLVKNGGIKAVLAKPFDPLTIADEIKEALGWS
jgi:CheY-like chemotaxis protein